MCDTSSTCSACGNTINNNVCIVCKAGIMSKELENKLVKCKCKKNNCIYCKCKLG